MTPEYVVNVGRQALEMMMLVSAPALLVALGIGLEVSVLQAVTQSNEETLTFPSNLHVVGITRGVAGPRTLSP